MKNSHWTTMKTALLGGSTLALLASSAAFAPSALAQDNDGAEEVEEVVVTGSRIRRAGFDTLQPAVSVDAEFLDERGFTNVAEALNQIPAFGTPGSSNTGGQFGGQNLGQNFVNTFGLGSQRTLVLINGRRTVGQNTPTVGATAATGLQVDLNIIPTVLIDRVETIFIGGAPIYGTDAIAGTVNVILKDDYEGFNADVQYGISERGDAQTIRARGLWGGNFADGRGNATVSIEYSEVSGLLGRDRERALENWSFCPNPDNTGPADGIADNVFCRDASGVFQVPEAGHLLTGAFVSPVGLTGVITDNGNPVNPEDPDVEPGTPLTLGLDGSLISWEEAGLTTYPVPNQVFFGNGIPCSNVYTKCLPETNTIISPLERYIFNANARYAINDNVSAFVETLYARSYSEDEANQPIWSTVFFGPGVGGRMRLNITDNPFFSDEIRDVLEVNGLYDPTLMDDPDTTDVDESDQFVNITRTQSDLVGDFTNEREQDVFRFVTGLEGDFDFNGRVWNWEASYTFGQTNANTRSVTLNGPRLGLAADAVRDPATGDIVCRSTLEGAEYPYHASQGDPITPADVSECMPFNPLGYNQNITDELRDYLLQDSYTYSQLQQQVFEATINGDLFDLNSGPVGFAAGITHRREFGRFEVDMANAIGLDQLTPVENVQGSYNTSEIYGETIVPLIEGDQSIFGDFGFAFINSMTAEGALRYVDNNRAGDDITWTLGGRMNVDLPLFGDGVTFRGNFTRAIRAPSIAELFQPRVQQFTFAGDPCDPRFINGGPNPAVRTANCQAEFASYSATLDPALTLGTFNSVIVNASQPAFSGGNPNLLNEKSNSYTYGAVITPEFMQGLTVAVDYVSITLNDAIIQVTGTQLLNSCFDDPNYPNVAACDKFTRDPESFQILRPELDFLNAAQRVYKGWQINANYQTALADVPFMGDLPGSVRLGWNASVITKSNQSVGGADFDNFAGEQATGSQKFQWQLNINYDLERFGFFWQTRFIGSGVYNNESSAEFREFSTTPTYTTHNMTLTYQFTDNLRGRLVVNNVFDKLDPPRLIADAVGNANLFRDIIGRRFVFGLTAEY